MSTGKKEDIIKLPHPHLRKRSKKIGFINDDTKKLISKMKQATLDWEDSREHEVGVALAAVQIDELLRVVIIRQNFNDKSNKNFDVFINPEITKLEGKVVEDHEGCLSIKDVYGLVPRHSKVRVRALNENGQEIRLKAEGFLARVFQHEIDHTNGIPFVDHIKNKPENFYVLDKDGKLEPLDYEKDVKGNKTLWT